MHTAHDPLRSGSVILVTLGFVSVRNPLDGELARRANRGRVWRDLLLDLGCGEHGGFFFLRPVRLTP